jgi:hypothetical protein
MKEILTMTLKLLLTLTTVTFMSLFILACGDDVVDVVTQGPVGSAGPAGPAGPAGSNGKDALTEVQTLTIKASRDYDPSDWFDAHVKVNSAAIQLPEVIPMTGSAGTGWASISLNGNKYCYQGDGKNNSDVGTQFEYVGLATSSECYMAKTSADLLFVEYFDDVEILVSVPGGGVASSIRTFTEIEAEITIRQFSRDDVLLHLVSLDWEDVN